MGSQDAFEASIELFDQQTPPLMPDFEEQIEKCVSELPRRCACCQGNALPWSYPSALGREMQDDPAEDSHRPFGSRCVAGPHHDGEHVLFGLIVELQGTDHREAAPAIVVAFEETGLLVSQSDK